MEKGYGVLASFLLLMAALSGCMQEYESDTESNIAPMVAITASVGGQTVSGVVSINGTASDPDGVVEKVEVRIESRTNISHGGEEGAVDDTMDYPDADYAISARSFDGERYSLLDGSAAGRQSISIQGRNIPMRLNVRI